MLSKSDDMRETMIKKLLYYFAVGLMFMCVSCGWFEEDQMGYPRTVTLKDSHIPVNFILVGIGIQMLFLMRKTVMKQSGING